MVHEGEIILTGILIHSSITFILLLSGFEIIKTASEEDVVLLLGIVVLVALAPVVAHGVGEDVAVLVERALGDGQVTCLTVIGG